MPELTRNQQFFLLQPPPHHPHHHHHHQQQQQQFQSQLKSNSNHQNLNYFLPYQLNSSTCLANQQQGKQQYWSHQWNNNYPSIDSSSFTTTTTTSTSSSSSPTTTTTTTTTTTKPLTNYSTLENYSSSSSSSSSSCCSSCCPSPKPPSTMNIYPVMSNFNYFNFDYQTDCDLICVIDFEATCDNYGGRRPPNDAIMEIIEFPAFIVDTRTRSVITTFHEYVRPVINPKLTYFCTQLTGITQHMVDQADIFPRVLERFEKLVANLMRERCYSSFAIATDGPWDIAHFFARQCQIHGLEFPGYAKRWINLKRVYADCYQVNPICLDNMLNSLGIRFDGRRHSGYYDALHITKLLLKLFHDGAILTRNEMLSWDTVGRKCWGNLDCGYIPNEPMYAIRYI